MSDFYIGFRVEIASRLLPSCSADMIEQYNAAGATQIVGLQKNGRITVSKEGGLITASGAEDKRKIPSKTGALVNFGVVIPMDKREDLVRIIQIINVLGNGRLIRERAETFATGQSMLNQLPELTALRQAMHDLESRMPGFLNSGWYYAPEATL